MITYTYRPDIFRTNITYSIEDGHINWKDEKGRSGTIEYKNIYQIRLIYTPSRLNKNQYQIEISETNGDFTKIKNIHFKGAANFEDRSKDYNGFVIELHKNISLVNPNVRFNAGVSSGKYKFYWLLLIFSILVLLAALLFMISFGFVWIAVAHILAMLYLFSISKSFMKKNKPRNYNPNNIPQNLLPKI